MSVDVISAVLKRSEARGVDRLVMLVIADVAHPDGVGWLHQTTIAERARCSTREVVNVIGALQALGEIEKRVAKKGRTRFNIYRICLEPVGQVEVDYERIPYKLDVPFSGLRPEQLAARTAGKPFTSSRRVDGVKNGTRRSAKRDVDGVHMRASHRTVLGPVLEPPTHPTQPVAENSGVGGGQPAREPRVGRVGGGGFDLETLGPAFGGALSPGGA